MRRIDESGLKVGDKVKYVGWHPKLLKRRGTVAAIVRKRDEYGFVIRYDADGKLGSATVEALERVK